VSALANAEVGDYLNKHFVATFQKVGSFRVLGAQKQGGNVASYFCTPDGGVLDAVAGPTDASTFLREARWAVETRKMALLDSGEDAGRYRAFFRLAHAQRLADEHGVADVDWRALPPFQPSADALASLLDNDRHAQQLDLQGRVHLLLAAFPLVKLDQAYKVIYEKILNEKVTTAPVVEGDAPAQARPTLAAAGASPGSGLRPGSDRSLVGAGVMTPEEARRQDQVLKLRRALDHPPQTDICSGQALNVLLADLVQQPADSAASLTMRLPAQVLEHLNLTTEHERANAALLRSGGQLPWPSVWRQAPLRGVSRELCESMDRLLPEVVAQAKKGRVDADLLDALRDDFDGLQRVLEERGPDLEPSRQVKAKRFLREVDDALKVLEGSDAARYLGGALVLDPDQIKTVRDLIRFMAENELVFAPAVSGDEAAYASLRRALAACDTGGAPTETDEAEQ
jgi:hypothetical protein